MLYAETPAARKMTVDGRWTVVGSFSPTCRN
jgi:hypothetical protein